MRLLCALIAITAAAQDFSARFEEIKRTATPAELYRFLYAMPKAGDIHMHFGLSFWAGDWWEEAKGRYVTRVRAGGCKPESNPLLYANLTREAWAQLPECERREYQPIEEVGRDRWVSTLTLDEPGEGRDEFFERIVPRVSALNRDTKLAMAVFRRSLARWKRENIRYVEIMGQPREPQAIEAWKKVAAEAPLAVRYQGIFIRFAPDAEERLLQVGDFVHENRDWWVGVNMAGREDNDKGFPLRFLEGYRELRRRHAGIRLTLHAGEVDSPGSQVRDALKLGAERIGHAVNLISDPDTMLLMRGREFLIEGNLISNRVLEYTPNLKQHPLIEYLRFGIPVCLNTDDQGSWDSNLTDEYFEAVRAFGLTWDEIVTMGRASIDLSFAPDWLKKTLRADFDQAIEKFTASNDWKSAAFEPSGYARRNLLQ
jgi:adenosine deaminase CECR1